jgi:hypothetical protein
MDLTTRRASADLQQIGRRALALANVLPRSTSADVREFAELLNDAADLLSSYADDLRNEVVQHSRKEAPIR